ncbi:MAG: hypothetical protein RL385_1314 [Pseudomonadota bacterium]|jgi:serine/threonine-protein kinase
MFRRLAIAAICIASLPAPVHAADAAAEALFQEAVRLLKRGEFDEACAKLSASHRREPRSGTLLNLAACEEQRGRTATAWALYKDAASLARSESKPGYADKATSLAAAVEPRLIYLHIAVNTPVAGEAITLDGKPLDPGSFETALPVDPGPHTLVAAAPGFASWKAELQVEQTSTLAVPALPAESSPAAASPAHEAEPATAPAPSAAPASALRAVPTWAWVTAGAGVSLLGTSVVFRVLQTNAGAELDSHCGADRQSCDPSYDFASAHRREQRDFALFVGLGSAGVVGAAIATYSLVQALRAQPKVDGVHVMPVLAVDRGALRAGLHGVF